MSYFPGQAPIVVSFSISADPVGAKNFPIYRAPEGGATVTSFMVSAAVTQGAGTAVVFALHNFGTVGTAINSGAGGTVHAGLGGTAAVITTGVPSRSTTFVSPYLEEGEYLVLAYTEQADWRSGDSYILAVEIIPGAAVGVTS